MENFALLRGTGTTTQQGPEKEDKGCSGLQSRKLGEVGKSQMHREGA